MNYSCYSYQQPYLPQCQCVCTVKGDPESQGPQGPPGSQGPQGLPGTPGTIIIPGPDGSLLRSNSTNPTGFDFVGNINIPPGTNAFLGQNSGNPAVTGINNTGFGQNTLAVITSGLNNTAVGFSVLASNTTGVGNTAVGGNTLTVNTTGDLNTAVGATALLSNITGGANTAVGFNTLLLNSSGFENTAIGINALSSNILSARNTALGANALSQLSTGSNNTGVGTNAGSNLISGLTNVFLGFNAGSTLVAGSNNLLLGANAQVNGNQSDNIVIGSMTSTAVSGRTFIAQVHNQTVGLDEQPVYINENGLLGTVPPSSIVFKENINPMQEDISTKLMTLNPVTFTYKNDDQHKLQYGLIAEEVLKILPELVFMKKADDESEPKPYGVSYEKLIPMLLFEIQRLNKKFEEKESGI